MTENPTPDPKGPEPESPTVRPPAGRRLHRSRGNRVVAGVAGGLGEATGVDPVIFRVLAVVLTLFGGVGVLLYAVGWLFLPESDTGESVADRALGRRGEGNDRTGTVALAIGLVVVAAIGIGAVLGNATATLLVLLSIGGLWLLLRRDESAPAWGAPVAGSAPWTSAPSGTPGQPGAPVGPSAPGGPGAPTGPYATFGPTPPPPPPRQRRAPSVLGPLTWSLVLIGLGVLTLADLSGADVAFAAYPALALAIVGLGLLVGTRYGRSRGLIALGVVAAGALGIGTIADVGQPFDRRLSNYNVILTDVGQLRPSYDFGFGRARLDMAAVNFQERTVSTTIDMRGGELVIIVPPDVDVVTDIDVRVGELRVFGRSRDGDGLRSQIRDNGPDGPGGGQLDLRVDHGLGRVEVRREAA